jgi:deazaflavin-dependent oxidoreductase (nitroreductase family)
VTRPDPIRRFLYRLPLLLDRAGLPALDGAVQRLLGIDWIVLETVGRRTGRPHVVVLDVIDHDRASDRYYVQPAYGEAADWVRNVRRESRVTARVGSRRVRGRVRDVTGAEGADAMLRFMRAHPRYARVVAWFVGHVRGLDRPDAELRRDFSQLTTLAVDVVHDG